MSDPRREAVAKAISERRLRPDMHRQASVAFFGWADYELADAALAAIDATPGPATVSEEHPLVSPELFDVGLDDLANEIERTFVARDGFGYTPDELLELRQYIKDVYRDTHAAALAARTTARAELTDAEIEAGAIALHDFTQEPSGQDRPWENFPDEYQQLFRERARVVLIAARNAGQEVTE